MVLLSRLLMFLVPVSFLFMMRERLILSRPYVEDKAKGDQEKNEKGDKEKEEILNCATARARANEFLKPVFGICNSFVDDGKEGRKFRQTMIELKSNLDKSNYQLLHSSLATTLEMLPERATLREVSMVMTMGAVLGGLLVEKKDEKECPLLPLPTFEKMLRSGDLIEKMWSTRDGEKRDELHQIIPSNVLSAVIPTWESQWRVVYYCLIEYYRNERQEIGNVENWVKETLRLYAPVKSLARQPPEGELVPFPIAERMKNRETWGEDALVFNPNRVFTPEQEEELKNVFGMGKLKCVAGLKFVQKFVGAIVKKVAEEYEGVEGEGEGAWQNLPSTLENKRGFYGKLEVQRFGRCCR